MSVVNLFFQNLYNDLKQKEKFMGKYIVNKSNVKSSYVDPDQPARTFDVSSNEVKVENISELFVCDRSSLWEYGSPNDEIQQNIILSNESSVEIKDIKLLETISEGATFKRGSVTIDDYEYPIYDIVQGFTLPRPIGANSSALVSYDLVINNSPSVQKVTAKTNVTYTAGDIKDNSVDTPEVEIEVTKNKLMVTKTTEQTYVIPTYTITYTTTIQNVGEYKNTNIKFSDMLPSGTNFVTGSVKVDNVEMPNLDPNVGFMLKDLDVGEKTEVTFSALVE